MSGDMSRVTLNFDLSKIPFCAFLARVKTYTYTKNQTCTFTGSHLRAVTDANDDDADKAGCHSTTTRATSPKMAQSLEVMAG